MLFIQIATKTKQSIKQTTDWYLNDLYNKTQGRVHIAEIINDRTNKYQPET